MKFESGQFQVFASSLRQCMCATCISTRPADRRLWSHAGLYLALLAAVLLGSGRSAFAANGTWNGSAGATWDTSPTNWLNLTGTPWNVTNGGTNTAVFNMAGASAAVSGTVWANGITFLNTASISGGTINLAGTTPTISATSGISGTISSALTGSSGLTKIGSGLLTLSGLSSGSANNYSGATTLSGGTLAIASNASLASVLTFGTAAGDTTTSALDLSSASAAFTGLTVRTNSSGTNTITIGAGQTLTTNGNVTIGNNLAGANRSTTVLNVTGASGTWNVNAAGGTFRMGLASSGTSNNYDATIVDLSGLGTFTANLGSGGSFVVGNTTADASPTVNTTLTLASGSNTITAGSLQVAYQSTSPVNYSLLLGGTATNVLNANQIFVGSGNRTRAFLQFTGTGAGTVRIRAADGSAAAGLSLNGGNLAGTPASSLSGIASTSTFDVTGHSADLLFSTVEMSNFSNPGSSSNPIASTFNFDTGTLVSSTFNIGTRSGGANNVTPTASVTLGSGSTTSTFSLGQVRLAQMSGAAGGITGNLTIQGASTTGTISSLAFGGASAAGGTSNGTLSINGGSLKLLGDITVTSTVGTVNSTLTLNGGTLDMGGYNIGGVNQIKTLNFQSGVLQNVGQINNGATLTKTTSGTLTLSGSNSYTGTTRSGSGTLILGSANALAGSTLDMNSADGGSLVFGVTGTTTYNIGGLTGSRNIATSGSVVMSVGANGASNTYSGVVSGGGAFAKVGAGTQTLTGSNTYTGATAVSAGQLQIGSAGAINSTSGITVNGAGAEFTFNAATALSQPLTLTQGTLSGTGTIGTAVTVGPNAILSPGNSPGSQSFTQGLTLGQGGRYTWEINNWAGSPGTNYDQLVVSGSALNITAISGSTFTIALTSLTAGNVAGAVPGFSGTAGTSFTIATSSAGITGFDKSKFSIDQSAFANTLPTNAGFWLSTNGGSTSLILNYAPSATYNLSANATAAAIRVGGSSTITATVTSSTASVTNPDSMAFTGLALSGLGTLSSTSGTLAGNATSSGSVVYTGTAGGAFTFNPSVSTATNVNIGSNANAGTSSGVTVNVYNVASATSSQTVSVGNMYAGSTKTAAVTLANTAPTNATYTETLSSGSFSSTTANFTTSGAVSGIAGGSSSSGTLLVGLGSGLAAGAQSGSTVLSLFTNAVNGSGLGQASVGSQTITITGSVYNMAAAASSQTVSLGNFRVGDTASKGFTLTNTAPANATYTETLGSGSFTSTSSGYTATGSVTGIAGLQSGSGSLAVGFSTATAGAKSGSTVLSLNSEAVNGSNLGTTGFASQTITITGGVYNYAAANSISGTINLGTVLKGTSLSQALSISNTAPAGSYTEKLDAAFGTPSANATASGSISLLAAGGTDSSSMTVGLGSATAGGKTGSVQVNFTSNGAGTSGLGTTNLASQTVNLVGTVLDPALASFTSGPVATTSLLLDFGSVNQNTSVSPLGFDFWNLMQTSGYTADLALTSIVGAGDVSVLTTTATSTFNTLASGTFNPYSVSFANTSTLGSFQSIYTFQFKSANNGTVFTGDTPQTLTLTVQGVIVVPEPGALALAGVGIAAAAWAIRRRKR